MGHVERLYSLRPRLPSLAEIFHAGAEIKASGPDQLRVSGGRTAVTVLSLGENLSAWVQASLYAINHRYELYGFDGALIPSASQLIHDPLVTTLSRLKESDVLRIVLEKGRPYPHVSIYCGDDMLIEETTDDTIRCSAADTNLELQALITRQLQQTDGSTGQDIRSKLRHLADFMNRFSTRGIDFYDEARKMVLTYAYNLPTSLEINGVIFAPREKLPYHLAFDIKAG